MFSSILKILKVVAVEVLTEKLKSLAESIAERLKTGKWKQGKKN